MVVTLTMLGAQVIVISTTKIVSLLTILPYFYKQSSYRSFPKVCNVLFVLLYTDFQFTKRVKQHFFDTCSSLVFKVLQKQHTTCCLVREHCCAVLTYIYFQLHNT